MDNQKQTQPVRVRFAPSPTGFLHVGGLRTALYDFLLARKTGGKFILRIEDTDQARLVDGALENIVETLSELGLAPDEGFVWDGGAKETGEFGPYLQSKRLAIYREHALQLVRRKAAYYCFCTAERLEQLRKQQQAGKQPPKYDKLCLKLSPPEVEERLARGDAHVIRLNVPSGKTIRFADMVHGEIAISTDDLDDQVLIKSDGFPTYHLAVVVDDHLMQITHVIRGDEWIPSTPKHILLYSLFGWESPQFVHLPLLLSKTKKKLSKRDGDVAVKDFLAQGYLPEALINFVALLGWNPKSEREIFTLEELVGEFAIEKINKSGAVFDLDKLDWINGHYIRQLPLPDLHRRLIPYLKQTGLMFENFPESFVQAVVKLEQDRLKKLSEIGERVAYFFTDPEYPADLLVWKKSNKEETQKNLQALYTFMQDWPAEKLSLPELEPAVKSFIAENGLDNGSVLWPLRAALSGLSASPGPFEIIQTLGLLDNGKDTILRRINAAIEKL